MNEKIRELATQVDPELAKDTIYCTSKDLEKFAELIVKECVNIAMENLDCPASAIDSYFGVEE